MRLFVLTALTMIAFAANSVLNRAALTSGDMTALQFSAIRALSGAMILLCLVLLRGNGIARLRVGSFMGSASLALYLIGFSLAYRNVDSGIGALILFGGAQITMFAGAVFTRENIPLTRWIGAGCALGGLAYLTWPTGASAPPVLGSLLMTAAALGWGGYSLIGRGVKDPLAATAANFLGALVPVLIAVLVFERTVLPPVNSAFLLAVVSGAITSGLGYALWYQLLPQLRTTIAAVAQLSVPIIAASGGAFFLSEGIGPRFWVASALVLGGIALSLLPTRQLGN
ncbi:DMT family transporter [Halocynthiibacter namhaensis]|uniref:DMT family transporter n=1 Tax=Halocynthiibacter namhaensis TaxID=1290553 RepID=UPI000579795C|nr:DMT family transporter [Halocynthiibacter namhaensis]